ncbi:hypothetical protein K474DRAFT_1776321 [Panus rudis PR-1116 ss-1]|nr:hypothetical protein K474DRAFT_1776321 [Panus rudis PR-1116 ss-1]
MSILHAYFHARNQQAFRRLLDTNSSSSNNNTSSHTHTTSSSGGKSWNRPSPLSGEVNVNARDYLGRTVLHLAASSTAASAPEYVRMLLAHPQINVNLQDYESHWTALHRALYEGNVLTATLLLQRQDIDVDLKDWEGYRAFDLFNSTVEGTKPGEVEGFGMLFTWGTNRNAALGLGDADDRTFPDQVVIERPFTSVMDTLDVRFEPVYVENVAMAKLHTGVITDEPRNNLRLCGFGSGGRLGTANNVQYTLEPIPLPTSTSTTLPPSKVGSSHPSQSHSHLQSQAHSHASQGIVQLALGQDHTLALTASGEVLSWGLNRFSQLGYIVESPGGGSLKGSLAGTTSLGKTAGTSLKGSNTSLGKSPNTSFQPTPHQQPTNPPPSITHQLINSSTHQLTNPLTILTPPPGKEEIQNTPRKVPGLRNKFVQGVAACKTASVCWSGSEVWTWGWNCGQLGYDKNASPVQVSPRIVTKVTQNVLAVTITDTAMAVLLESHDVMCFWNNAYCKINFPTQSFPSEITTYRPPHAVRNANIRKVVSCEQMFAALSSHGELFTWSLGEPPASSSSNSTGMGMGMGMGRDKEGGGGGGGSTSMVVKPQRVWALRKQFSAVKDVALGADGSIIICTESGHVFVRSRTFKAVSSLSSIPSSLFMNSSNTSNDVTLTSNPNSNIGGFSSSNANANTKTFKFQRVPYIQRVRSVCANSTGAFAAIRVDPRASLSLGVGDGRDITCKDGGKAERVRQSLEWVRPWEFWDWPPPWLKKLKEREETQKMQKGKESKWEKEMKEKKKKKKKPHFIPDFDDLDDHHRVDVDREYDRDYEEEDQEREDAAIERDGKRIRSLCLRLQRECALYRTTGHGTFHDKQDTLFRKSMKYGADLFVHGFGFGFELEVPVHKVILAARSPVLCRVLQGGVGGEIRDREGISIQFSPSSPSPAKPDNPHDEDQGEEGLHPAPWTYPSHLTISGINSLTLLILLEYLYTDDPIAVWDPRLASVFACESAFLYREVEGGIAKSESNGGGGAPRGKSGKDEKKGLGQGQRQAKAALLSAQIKVELQRLARVLELGKLEKALEAPVKRMPEESLREDLRALFESVQSPLTSSSSSSSSPTSLSLSPLGDDTPKHQPKHPFSPDVILLLENGQVEVPCHSIILRARSEFFAALFGGDDNDDVWTRRRWDADGVIRVDLGHLRWKSMRFVMKWVYGGEAEIFDRLEFVNSVDELLEFMFEVMAAANELLLDRLVLICSSIIVKRVTIANASSILVDATHFNATALTRSIQHYISINLETLLESHMLDDLPIDILKQLSNYIRERQKEKSPVSREGVLVKEAMEKFKDWVALQDFPVPITKSGSHPSRVIGAARLSPPGPSRKKEKTPSTSPALRPQIPALTPLPVTTQTIAEDEMFVMDESVPSLNLTSPPLASGAPPPVASEGSASSRPSGGWKIPSTPKVDMKAIMAEAATATSSNRLSNTKTASSSSLRQVPVPSDSANWRTPPRVSKALPDTLSSQAGPSTSRTSPWKIPSGGNATVALPSPPATPSRPQDGPPLGVPIATKSQPLVKPGGGTKIPSLRQPPTPPRTPGLGPIFVPTKQTPPSKAKAAPGVASGVRRVSSGSAWTLPPVQPVVQPSPSTSSTKGAAMSFVAIQQLQLEQEFAPVKDKRSLKEIQEEEEARQAEEDFLRWWAAEEERVRLEQIVNESEAVRSERDSGRGGRERKKGKGKAAPPQGQGAGSQRLQQGRQERQDKDKPSNTKSPNADGGGQRRKRRPQGGRKDGAIPAPSANAS